MHRIFRQALPLIALLSSGVESASAENFTGSWGSEHNFVIFQRGAKACGFWRDVATNTEYEGRFIGRITGNELRWESVCGVPGGAVTKWCPPPSVYAEVLPKDASLTGWQHAKTRARLCNGKLYLKHSGEIPASCSSISEQWQKSAMPRSKSKKGQELPGDHPTEKRWLETCLADG